MHTAASKAFLSFLILALVAPSVVGAQHEKTNFFVTSVGPGKGGDLGGLAGVPGSLWGSAARGPSAGLPPDSSGCPATPAAPYWSTSGLGGAPNGAASLSEAAHPWRGRATIRTQSNASAVDQQRWNIRRSSRLAVVGIGLALG